MRQNMTKVDGEREKGVACDSLRRSLPSSLEGIQVKIVETGEFFAQ
jgi:hypothetical protein